LRFAERYRLGVCATGFDWPVCLLQALSSLSRRYLSVSLVAVAVCWMVSVGWPGWRAWRSLGLGIVIAAP
jgi:hypothetical protein